MYDSLANSSCDKYQVLSYLETRIQDSRISNVLIDSIFLRLFVSMLKDSKNNYMVKLRLCSIIGSLMRHATTVDSEIYLHNLPEVLGEVLIKEK
jgi:serine/threonine-protein kinase ULK4